MSVIERTHRVQAVSRAEDGVTMIIAMLVMLVTSLLLVAVFTAANGDTQLSHIDLTQKQAYYAAFAGIQEYEYKLESNPDYWESCPTPSGKVKSEESESYAVTTLAANSDPESGEKKCTATNPFKTIIESKGALTNTFRIESTGKAGTSKRSLIATFQVAGFLNYIYFTKYEVQDPDAYKAGATEKKDCENYRPEREALEKQAGINCVNIEFAPEDSVKGPMKTDDSVLVCGEAEFGRKGQEPPDPVEIDLGVVLERCSGSPKYNTANGKPTEGAPELVPPESDGSLRSYVESTNELSGLTYLELNGATNKIKVTKGTISEEIEWPENGLIYVQANGTCGYTEFEQNDTDTAKTLEEEKNCGTVYVKGTYSKSLTIAAENDLVINGNITPYGVTPGEAPPATSTATLGLIATEFIRMYHPIQEYEGSGPELETVAELEGATHKKVVKLEPKSGSGVSASELKVEVKELHTGTEYEVVISRNKGYRTEVLETISSLKNAKELIGHFSSYVTYEEGVNYSEGKAEKLKALNTETLGHEEVIKVEPKSPKLGKELQVEVKESGSEDEVVILNTKAEPIEAKKFKEAKELIGTWTSVVFKEGANYTKYGKERLKPSSAMWLDETCNSGNEFDSASRMCEYPHNGGASCPNASGSLIEPWVYAAILSTNHSFLVDNYECGASLDKLNIYGAIAQKFRGIVGTTGGTGYIKDYKYDERLATDEPPYFLAPLKAGWRIARLTAPSAG